jgi:hypothetical protein
MRVLAVTSGLLVAALLQAAPAVAHSGQAIHKAGSSATEPVSPARVCEIDLKRLEAFLATQADAARAKPDAKQSQKQRTKRTAQEATRPAVAQNRTAPCAPPSDDPNGVVVSPSTPAPLG